MGKKKRELRTVDPHRLQTISYRCTSCGFQEANYDFFGKIQVPTPSEEAAPGIPDPFIFLCSSCFKEASVDIMRHRLRVLKTPTKEIVVHKKESPAKTIKQEVKERVKESKKSGGGLFS